MPRFEFTRVDRSLVFGLSCDIVRTPLTHSKFQVMDKHPQSEESLFGGPRLAGFAGMLKLGYTSQLLILGKEQDGDGFHQSDAIVKIVEEDYGAPRGLALAAEGGYGTDEAAAAIPQIMADRGFHYRDVAVCTSHYHLPRLQVALAKRDIFLPGCPAEVFYLLDHTDAEGNLPLDVKKSLLAAFGGGEYAHRVVNECIGISRMVGGFYKPQGTKLTA